MTAEERLRFTVVKKRKISEITEEVTTAYFDLEFCNERISRHNVPIAIGISYRQGQKEIGSYHTLIWCGDDLELWNEQLIHIGYSREELKKNGKPMEAVTEELLAAHEKYQPELYVSFGKQDETLLKKFVTQELEEWNFRDALKFLPKHLGMKYDISLEKYAYICQIEFIHQFDPLADARSLAQIIWCVQQNRAEEARRNEVAEEYERRLFLIQYRNKQQAYEYLKGLEELTSKQREKLNNHGEYLKKNRQKYLAYIEE